MSRLLPLLLLGLTAFAGGAPGGQTTAAAWRAAGPGKTWEFPRDHHSHPGYKTEWWYVTGQVAAAADPTRRYGFQFTLFRVGITPERPDLDSAWVATDLVMGHASITDLTTGRHVFSEVLTRACLDLGGFGAPGDSLLAWSRAPAGTPGRWAMTYRDGRFGIRVRDRRLGMGFDLELQPERPPVLQGPGGFSEKDPATGSGSLYYSLTRLDTRGRLTLHGETAPVEGSSWLDREIFSSQLGQRQVGWDWFSLQLDDGRDLMLYRLRRADGSTSEEHATLVAADGTVTYLDTDDLDLEVRRRWRSPETGADYPVGWRLQVPGEGLDLEVDAIVLDQENVSRRTEGLFYWEGAVAARGRGVAGQGYAEMTGYGPGSRPPI